MKCRICEANSVLMAGIVEYYSGYPSPVYDCPKCLCRFTPHINVAEKLHLDTTSCYALQAEFAQRAKASFDAGDLDGLKEWLDSNPKYQFIIDTVSQAPKASRILEVGCSRGYLASRFILEGRDVTGVDISKSAIESARKNFGPFFFMSDDPIVAQRAPYDIIYHIGTIGCVQDPRGLTRSLLRMLKPGGKLLFNAPNAKACWLTGQLWIDFAPPPDVVTLYTPGFWTRCFSNEASVTERVEHCSADDSFAIRWRRLFHRWRPPRPISLSESYVRYKYGPRQTRGRFEKLTERLGSLVAKILRKLGLISRVRLEPTPFGLFVTLQRK